jgi:hypothetical protein
MLLKFFEEKGNSYIFYINNGEVGKVPFVKAKNKFQEELENGIYVKIDDFKPLQAFNNDATNVQLRILDVYDTEIAFLEFKLDTNEVVTQDRASRLYLKDYLVRMGFKYRNTSNVEPTPAPSSPSSDAESIQKKINALALVFKYAKTDTEKKIAENKINALKIILKYKK